MKLIIVDTETSDLDPKEGAQILEIAWLELTNDSGSWNPTFNGEYYIEYSGPISPKAAAVHHIPASRLTKEQGAFPRAYAINHFLGRIAPDSIMVAHNAQFDKGFLPEVTVPWICTMRSARHLWQGAPGYSNQVLRYYLNLDIIKIDPVVEQRYPHQARYDVATTTGILLKMLQMVPVEQLIVMSASPVRLKNISFGKYEGMPFDQVPLDYLQWLRARPNLDVDLKYTINTILER
jgi:exodeoxyribonuclease X